MKILDCIVLAFFVIGLFILCFFQQCGLDICFLILGFAVALVSLVTMIVQYRRQEEQTAKESR